MLQMKLFTLVAIILCGLFASGQRGHAEGALAFLDVKGVGVYVGAGGNYDTSEEAKARALTECQEGTHYRCSIVATFRHACLAFASMPNSSDAGYGWAVAPTMAKANAQALAKCKAMAGAAGHSCSLGRVGGCDN
jgi:hypothetical protein